MRITEIDPSSDSNKLPGKLTWEENGEERSIESYGGIVVGMTDADHNTIRIKDGMESAICVPIA